VNSQMMLSLIMGPASQTGEEPEVTSSNREFAICADMPPMLGLNQFKMTADIERAESCHTWAVKELVVISQFSEAQNR
jgi:hypothetical protein